MYDCMLLILYAITSIISYIFSQKYSSASSHPGNGNTRRRGHLKFTSFHGLFAPYGKAHSPFIVRPIRHCFLHFCHKHNKFISKQQTVSTPISMNSVYILFSCLKNSIKSTTHHPIFEH